MVNEISNPNADDHAQRLYKILYDVYGKYSFSGQYMKLRQYRAKTDCRLYRTSARQSLCGIVLTKEKFAK